MVDDGVAESADVSPVLVRDFGSLPRLRKPNMASRFKINQTDQIVKFGCKKSLINAFWGDQTMQKFMKVDSYVWTRGVGVGLKPLDVPKKFPFSSSSLFLLFPTSFSSTLSLYPSMILFETVEVVNKGLKVQCTKGSQ